MDISGPRSSATSKLYNRTSTCTRWAFSLKYIFVAALWANAVEEEKAGDEMAKKQERIAQPRQYGRYNEHASTLKETEK